MVKITIEQEGQEPLVIVTKEFLLQHRVSEKKMENLVHASIPSIVSAANEVVDLMGEVVLGERPTMGEFH